MYLAITAAIFKERSLMRGTGTVKRGPARGGVEGGGGGSSDRKGTRTDRRRRRPSCAVDCTTKGAIMRPFSNHRAFCPPFDPSGFPLPSPVPFSGAASPETNPILSRARARYIARPSGGYRVFLFKCTQSTCRRAPVDLNAIRGVDVI